MLSSKEVGMSHPIYRVISFEIQGPYTLRVCFDDDTERVIDFQNTLEGELFGPLRNRALFNQVQIDPEVYTLVWPNGADFDPATLHDWPEHLPELKRMATRWSLAETAEYHIIESTTTDNSGLRYR